jgi:hypothetical protein
MDKVEVEDECVSLARFVFGNAVQVVVATRVKARCQPGLVGWEREPTGVFFGDDNAFIHKMALRWRHIQGWTCDGRMGFACRTRGCHGVTSLLDLLLEAVIVH